MQGATVAAMLLDEHFSAFEAGWAAIVGEVEQYGGAQVRAVLSAAFDTCFSPCSAYVRASSGATAVALQLHNNMTEDLAAALGDCTEIGRSAAAAAHAADAAFSAAAVDLDDGRPSVAQDMPAAASKALAQAARVTPIAAATAALPLEVQAAAPGTVAGQKAASETHKMRQEQPAAVAEPLQTQMQPVGDVSVHTQGSPTPGKRKPGRPKGSGKRRLLAAGLTGGRTISAGDAPSTRRVSNSPTQSQRLEPAAAASGPEAPAPAPEVQPVEKAAATHRGAGDATAAKEDAPEAEAGPSGLLVATERVRARVQARHAPDALAVPAGKGEGETASAAVEGEQGAPAAPAKEGEEVRRPRGRPRKRSLPQASGEGAPMRMSGAGVAAEGSRGVTASGTHEEGGQEAKRARRGVRGSRELSETTVTASGAAFEALEEPWRVLRGRHAGDACC